jgi:trimeric autotransporter adhesin
MMNFRPLLLTVSLALFPALGFSVTPPVNSDAALAASNRGANDYFGTAVAISGDTMVVGAPFEDGSSTGVGSPSDGVAANAGAAYVYVRNEAGNWTQEAYLKASNTGAGDQFGFSVAISGDTIVVGAFAEASKSTGPGSAQNDNTALNAGAAYVFVRENSTWTQEAYLKASNTEAADLFGYAVAIEGETIVVGAIGESSINSSSSDNTASQAGAAYVFTRSGTEWSQDQYLKASNPNKSDLFGISVGISGETIVVGATGESSSSANDQANNSAVNSGAAYVFKLDDSGSWEQDGYLKASNAGAADQFGRSVAVSGNTIVVGAYQEDSKTASTDNLASNSGAAYLFVRGSTKWTEDSILKPSNTAASDNFGISVAIDEDALVIGASGKANKTGTAYTYSRVADEWTEDAILTADPASNAADNFGAAVAISFDTSVVGAFGEKEVGSPALTLAGAVYAFEGLGPQVSKIVVQNGFGTVLTSDSTINFSSVASANDQEQTFTIQNRGITDLTDIILSIEKTKLTDPALQFTLDTTLTATTLEPDGFTTFKVKMTGTGLPTGILKIASSDPNTPVASLKLAGKSFSQTADSDGDGLPDYAEYQLRTLGFDWEVAQPELVATLKDNASFAGLYDTNSALKLGVPLLVRNPTTNVFTMTIGIERSFDLKTYAPFPMTEQQVLINSQGELQFQFSSIRSQAFYRLQTE